MKTTHPRTHTMKNLFVSALAISFAFTASAQSPSKIDGYPADTVITPERMNQNRDLNNPQNHEMNTDYKGGLNKSSDNRGTNSDEDRVNGREMNNNSNSDPDKNSGKGMNKNSGSDLDKPSGGDIKSSAGHNSHNRSDKNTSGSHVKSHPDGFMMKNGKMMEFKNGQMMPMDRDMNMTNGTKLMRDGSIIKTDGSRTILREGEHMNMAGNKIPMQNTAARKAVQPLQKPVEKRAPETKKNKTMYLVPDSNVKKIK